MYKQEVLQSKFNVFESKNFEEIFHFIFFFHDSHFCMVCKDIIIIFIFPASSIAKKMLSMSLVIMFDIVWLIFAPSTPLIDAIKIPFALRQFSSRGNLGPSLLFIFTTPECSVNILVIFTDYYWFFTFSIFIVYRHIK